MSLRIEVIEPEGFKVGATHHNCGDIFTSNQGQLYVNLGWAKNCETGESGERIAGVSKINPDNIIQPTGD
ncbi:MAG: hypothetical protein GY928_00570 [Colwellia sp.]|nr:hypothetical protein [Colwellia sp.]